MNKNKNDQEYSLEVLKRLFGIQDESETSQFDLHKLHSKYWMDNIPNRDVDLISLATYRRAVAKFVRVSTLSAGIDKKIDVKFNVQDNSFTNSENIVVISAKIKNFEFDAVVGLALHESNHIILTDSSISRRLVAHAYSGSDLSHGELPLPLLSSLISQINRLSIKESDIRIIANQLRNWIEDRRIDYDGYNRSPGYRPYYKATYDKYFGAKIIGLALKSSFYRKVDIPSYMFRIVNSINPESDLDALPGLRKISEMLDLRNISRLKSNYDSAQLGMKILSFVLSHFPDPVEGNEEDKDEKDENEKNQKNQKNKRSGGGENGDENEKNESGRLPDDMINVPNEQQGQKQKQKQGQGQGQKQGQGQGQKEKQGQGQGQKENKKLSKLTIDQIKKLRHALNEQNEYIDGNVNKEGISKLQKKMLDVIDKPGITFKKVQGDYETGMNVIVVNKINKEILIKLPIASLVQNEYGIFESIEYPSSVNGIAKGIKLGKLLARRLQVRNENKTYHSKRKTSGKIDKRLLYGLGFGDTSIFEKVQTDNFGEAIAHISIDASGSMAGTEWEETMTAITAIAYAAQQVENLDIVISFRSTLNHIPLMVIAYDSRKDSFKKIKKLFPCIHPSGITPEGLCYEAIIQDILSSSRDKVGYFINFSDGLPNMVNNFNSNAERNAEDIAKKEIDKMRRAGIKVLSFYVNSYGERDEQGNLITSELFKYMYGKDARSISVDEVVPLTKELNKLFSTQKR